MMKTIFITFIFAIFGLDTAYSQVGIGTNSPNPNSVLDVVSTTKGFLPPRMTTAQRDAMPSPIGGITIFNTTSNTIEFSDGTDWVNLTNNTKVPVNTGAVTGQGLVGINTSTPNPNSALDLESTTKGFLPPRMTTTERNTITSPATGLVIFNTTVKCLQWYNSSVWMDGCTPSPVVMFTATAPIYNGQSVIDSQGVAYNGEVVPPAATIVVEVSVSAVNNGVWSLSVVDAASGLAYSGSGIFTASGLQTITLNPGTATISPLEFGIKSMTLSGAPFSNTKVIDPRIDIKSIPASATAVADVTFGTQTWMDRNLGARRAATAANDVFSYGNHYQWGRPADGHEISVWNGANTTSGRGFYNGTVLEALATSDTPGHPNFILTTVSTDWRNPTNENRWATANQGPCPTGYRVPTAFEWETADSFGSWNNGTDAFNSPLKLSFSGSRSMSNNSLVSGTQGRNWSSTTWLATSGRSYHLFFRDLPTPMSAAGSNSARAFGFSVRCIKN